MTKSSEDMSAHYVKTRAYFNKAAVERKGLCDKVKSFPYWAQQRVRNLILDMIDNSNKVILEAGCGMGDFSVLLARTFPDSSIIGIDFSEDMLELGEAYKKEHGILNVSFKLSDIRKTGFSDDEFDLTICMNVLHHIDKDDLVKTLNELARITRKTIILEIKNRNTPYHFIKKMRGKLLMPTLTIYATTVTCVKELIQPNGFNLTCSAPIFKFAIISPIIVLRFDRNR